MAENAIEESRRYKAAITPKIAAANKNLGKRIRAQGMEIEYLPDQDRLYVTFGPVRPSEAFPLGDGTHAVIMLDPKNYEITGVDAPFFMEDLAKIEQKKSGFWQVIADLIGKGGNYVYIPPEADFQRTEKALLDLLPAS